MISPPEELIHRKYPTKIENKPKQEEKKKLNAFQGIVQVF